MRDKARLIEVCKSLNPKTVPEAHALAAFARLWERNAPYSIDQALGHGIAVDFIARTARSPHVRDLARDMLRFRP